MARVAEARIMGSPQDGAEGWPMTTSANFVRAALFYAVISTTFTQAASAGGRRLPILPTDAPTAFDEGLYVDEGGPVSGSKGWLRLDTDACGLPEPDHDGRIVHQTGAWDEPEPDESDLRWMVFNMWLSTHPQIVVVSDGVDKSCADSVFEDDDFDPSVLAGWTPAVDRHLSVRFVHKSTFEIA